MLTYDDVKDLPRYDVKEKPWYDNINLIDTRKRFMEYLGFDINRGKFNGIVETVLHEYSYHCPTLRNFTVLDNDQVHIDFIEQTGYIDHKCYYIEHEVTLSKQDLIDRINKELSKYIAELPESKSVLLKKIYLATCDSFKQRNLTEKGLDNHHVIPRCLGGDYDSDWIKITHDEHILLHAMLLLMYPNNWKLFNGFIKMRFGKDEDNSKFNLFKQDNMYLAKEYAKMYLYNGIKKNWVTMNKDERQELFSALIKQHELP